MKTCKRCDQRLPVEAFYRHAQMGDGRLSFCKDCVKARVREHRRNNPHVLMAQRAKGSQWDREKLRPYETPEVRRAHYAVEKALKQGVLTRPSCCSDCGSSEYGVEAAHRDYTEPLDIRWLCRRCHRRWDQNTSKTLSIRVSAGAF